MGDRGVEHVDQHRLVARRHHDHVRDRAEVGDVEGTVVGRAVVADEAGAIHREGDVEVLQADVVDDLVEGTLEEGRVDRADGLGTLQRHAGGEQDRVLLGDADVVILLGALVAELLQAGPPRHRRGDPDHPLVGFGLGDDRVGEDLRVLRRRARCRRFLEQLDALRRVGFGHRHRLRLLHRGATFDDRVRLRRVPLLHRLQAAFLGRREALALDGVDVDDDRAVGGEGLGQSLP